MTTFLPQCHYNISLIYPTNYQACPGTQYVLSNQSQAWNLLGHLRQ